MKKSNKCVICNQKTMNEHENYCDDCWEMKMNDWDDTTILKAIKEQKKNKTKSQKIKCPHCEQEGHTYLEDRRWFYKCDGLCQMNILLKLLNNK